MLTAEQFAQGWRAGDPDDRVIRFEPGAVAALQLASESAAFLSESGLPVRAPPSLMFDFPNLPPAADLLAGELKRANRTRERLQRLIAIGLVDEDELVCLDMDHDARVVYLKRANRHKAVLINSSLPQLAHCLLLYRDLVELAETPANRKQLLVIMRAVDEAACKPGTYWYAELTRVIAYSDRLDLESASSDIDAVIERIEKSDDVF